MHVEFHVMERSRLHVITGVFTFQKPLESENFIGSLQQDEDNLKKNLQPLILHCYACSFIPEGRNLSTLYSLICCLLFWDTRWVCTMQYLPFIYMYIIPLLKQTHSLHAEGLQPISRTQILSQPVSELKNKDSLLADCAFSHMAQEVPEFKVFKYMYLVRALITNEPQRPL